MTAGHGHNENGRTEQWTDTDGEHHDHVWCDCGNGPVRDRAQPPPRTGTHPGHPPDEPRGHRP